jgi:hypothetical protein
VNARRLTTDVWLDVDLPGGGQVPLGYALLIAGIVLLDPMVGLVLTGVGVGLAVLHPERRTMLLTVAGGGWSACAISWAIRSVGGGTATTDLWTLLHVGLAGTAFLGVDALVEHRQWRRVAPVYLALGCAAALLAIASRHSAALGLVAAVPLLVTKYSFGRFADIRRTYAQTTRALSLLPEVAGLTPLGHGERTAVYAAAVATHLGFDLHAVDRIATAARLHHIGHISLHEPEERIGPLDAAELQRVSGELLRETGFLDDVAEIVERCQDVGPAATEMEPAIVRVCSTLDDLVEAGMVDPFAAVVRHHPVGAERTAAIALMALNDRRPDLVADARAASRILAQVAASADHGGQAGADPSHDCR